MSKYEVRRWILDRLKEKTTYGSLASLAGLFGLMIAPDQLEAIGAAVIVIAGLFGIAKKEDV